MTLNPEPEPRSGSRFRHFPEPNLRSGSRFAKILQEPDRTGPRHHYIHSVGILLSSEESSVRGSVFSLSLVRVCSSHYPHHPPPLMVELCGPIIPVFELFGRGF